LCRAEHAHPSSDPITARIYDARFSRLKSMRCDPLFDESQLLSTSFTKCAIDEGFKPVFDPIPAE
jgi:hypothetical protein